MNIHLRKTHLFFIIFLLGIFLHTATYAWAVVTEKIQVTGKIVDAAGEPVIGANVVVKGTTNGVISDIDGKFEITAERNSTLAISYIGYVTTEVKVTKNVVTVVLKDNAKALNEVIVVGYGTQKKSDITGAMVNVTAEALEQAPVANLGAALQGLAADVDVQMADGATHPSATPQIRIRGERSIKGGNDALIVVDGIPFAGNLNEINNDDVANISILKDASATAIYGSRGANGVILVTTKRGSNGKVSVSYSGYYGITTALKKYDVMNSEEFIRLKKWAQYNVDPDKYAGIDDPELMKVGIVFRDQEEMDGYQAGTDTDWQDLIFRNGMTTNHQVSLTGGSDRTTYSASVGYYRGENNYEAHSFERMTAKLSLDSKINRYLKVGFSTLNTYIINKGQDTNPMEMALRASPFTTPYNEEGALRTYLPGSGQNVWNPLLDQVDGAVVDDRKSLASFNTGYAEISLPFGIRYRFNGGFTAKYNNIGQFQASNTTKRMGAQDWAFGEYGLNIDYTLENLIMWDHCFNQVHNLSFTGLFSVQQHDYTKNNITSLDYFDDNIQYFNPSKALGDITGGGDYEKWGLLSYMARLNYNFKEKYLLTATVRYDGSSRLAEGNRWHAFPSVALGWNILRESFMENNNTDVLSGLKLRASWGNVGNTAINAYQTIATLKTDEKYLLGNTGVLGARPNSVPDTSLGWENTESYNIGIDFGFLNNRITGALEWYQQNTTDLLLPVKLPATSGYSEEYLTNRGATRNRGLEFNVSTINIAGDGQKQLEWRTDLNLFGNRNKIVSIGEGVERDVDNGWFVGEDRYVIYSLEADGLWQDTPEDRALAETFGYAVTGKNSVIGTVKVKNHHIDYEEDGNGNKVPAKTQKINDDDRVFIGKRAPKFEGGINNRFAWHGFDLSFLFTFRYGGTITSEMHNGWMNTMQGGYNNLNIDYWTPDNPSARWPKPSSGTIANKGLLARYDGSYLKLRNFTVGYTLPKSILSVTGIQSARVYATGSNLYTWFSKEYRNDGGIDPETTSTIKLKTPPTRSFVFGVNVSF